MKKIFEDNYNYRAILNLIITNDGISRAQIARETSLNRSTITYIINTFLENNLVLETTQKVLTGGRASSLIKFNFDIEQIMLVDIQKNKIKVLVTTYSGDKIERFDFPIDHIQTDNIEYIKESIHSVLSKFPMIHNCGVSIHGIVSTTTNTISSPFYHYEFDDIYNIFCDLGLNIIIENEANIFANGIYIKTHSIHKNLLNIHIKDGIGSGQILNHHLYRGDNGFAGEIGHSIAVVDGLPCRCGNNGCLELYASEQYFSNQFEKITGNQLVLEDINMHIQHNPKIAMLYKSIIKFLSVKINDLLLFTDVHEIYITSDIFNEIPNIKNDILNRLNSNNYVLPNISVIKADNSLFVSGFSRIILEQQYSLKK